MIFVCRYFSSRASLDYFTHSLNAVLSSDNACTNCGKNDQWVSHGYFYKKASDDTLQIAGKRIICTNRYGRSGCGRTRQLYLSDVIPKRRYRISVVIAFIKALLQGALVEQAYLDAIGDTAKEARHAWRWIKNLMQQLSVWRTLISKPVENFVPSQQSADLNVLLPTLERLFNRSFIDCIHLFQRQFQRVFF